MTHSILRLVRPPLHRAAGPVGLVGLALLAGFSSSTTQGGADEPVRARRAAAELVGATPPFSSTVPTDIANPADPQQAAQFAWQEFVALTWPAQANPAVGSSGYSRGQASTTAASGGTGPGGVTVWETFYHRDELYPDYATGSGNPLPDPDAAPHYLYTAPIALATPGTDLTLFDNADEASEINIANMYPTPFAVAADALSKAYPNPTPAQAQEILDAGVKASLVYEAKGNPVIFNYLKATGFNNVVPRRHARQQAVNQITNMPTTGPVFELPSGSIEIKASFRRYDKAVDDLSTFHWANGIYYTKSKTGGLVANFDLLRSGIPSLSSRAEVLREFVQHTADGKFTVPVARTFALEDWRTALDVSLKGSARGKLVLIVGQS